MTRRLALAATLLLAAIGCASVARPAGPVLSPAATMREAGMVAIRTVVPDIDQDIRYFGSDNFVGTRVDGYLAPHCWLKREAAEALARVERRLRESHQRLRIFDCYRPTRAVAHFMRWANDPADLATKARHYPDFDKPQLLDGYIAPVSGHSRGATVDLTLLQCDAACRRHDSEGGEKVLAEGFRNYPMEWWHFTLQLEPTPGLLYDIPVDAPEPTKPDAATGP